MSKLWPCVKSIASTLAFCTIVLGNEALLAAAPANNAGPDTSSENVYPFIPKRDARITDDAQAAANLHYSHPEIEAVHERYGRFISGVNREWLVEAHVFHASGTLPMKPTATSCQKNQKAIEDAARRQPFSLHIAIIQSNCAENQNSPEAKRFDDRVQANFARMAQSASGEVALDSIAIFNVPDAHGFMALMGYQWAHEFFDSKDFQGALYFAVGVLEAKNGDKKYRNFYFNLIGEELAAGLDAHRFSNFLSYYLLWHEGFSGFAKEYASASYLLNGATDGVGPAFKTLIERPLDLEMAVIALQACSLDSTLSCPARLLEPLMQAAEADDPVALMALAHERIFGLINAPNVKEGMLLWNAAVKQSGTFANQFLLLGVSRRVISNALKNRMLGYAMQGDSAAQLHYLASLTPPEMQAARKDPESGARRIEKLVLSKPRNALTAAVEVMLQLHLHPDQADSPDQCALWSRIRISSMTCVERYRTEGEKQKEIDALLAIGLNNSIPVKIREIARKELSSALLRAGRVQDAADAHIALLFDAVKVDDLDVMLLAGMKPSNVTFEGIKKNFEGQVDFDVLRIQWEVADKPNEVISRLKTKCESETLACHALIPIVHRLPRDERDAVINKAAKNDPTGTRSLAAELQARLVLRASNHDTNLQGLQAFERLKAPSDAAALDYLWLRCASPSKTLADPSRTGRYLIGLFSKNSEPEIAEVVAHCMASNKMLAAAISLVENAIKALNSRGIVFQPYYDQLQAQLKHLNEGKHVPAERMVSQILPLLELADRANRWAITPSTVHELDEAKTLLAGLHEESTTAVGQGLAVMLERVNEGKLEWFGNDSTLLKPLFLREVRANRESIAVSDRYCEKDGNQWTCRKTSVGTDFFFTSLDDYQLMDAQTQTDESCKTGRCRVLQIRLFESDLSQPAKKISRMLLERLSFVQVLTFEADRMVILSAEQQNTSFNLRYSYSYDEAVANPFLPKRCKPLKRSDAAAPEITKTIIVRGQPVRTDENAEVIATFRGDLKDSELVSILKLMSEKTPSENQSTKKQSADQLEVCTY